MFQATRLAAHAQTNQFTYIFIIWLKLSFHCAADEVLKIRELELNVLRSSGDAKLIRRAEHLEKQSVGEETIVKEKKPLF